MRNVPQLKEQEKTPWGAGGGHSNGTEENSFPDKESKAWVTRVVTALAQDR